MTVVLAGLACGVAGVALAALVYERQLRRLARSLRERDAHSNTRLTVEAPGRGFAELAAAVNGQLAAAEARLDDMGALLDQLFAYAQASDPDLALDLRPVRVLPLLADVLVGHYPAFDERGWEPQVDFEDEALATDADAEALARIFENLVGNVLRHGASTLAVRQRGRVVTFANEVADPSALDVTRLFERFYRADASRSASGAGLGLAVSASLAEAMGMCLSARLEGGMLCIDLELSECFT